MPSYISVSGYGWSGSSACIDILKEFEGFGVFNGEFRIAKDPYGLIDLEESLVHNWDFVRHDVAIKDFLNYCKVLGRDTGLFSRSGKDFSNKLDVDFMSKSKTYVYKITDMVYLGDTSVHRYNIPAYKNFFMKIRSKIGESNAEFMYLARPDKSNFIKETRNYINSLFGDYIDSNKINTLVLDQAVPPTNISNSAQFFEKIKVIIIDRDPRDIYSNLVRNKVLIGADLSNSDSADKYSRWHKILRSNLQGEGSNKECYKDVLRLNFEDLVCNYEQSVSKIIDFIGVGIVHKNKYNYFNPESIRSKSNVGLWKEYKNQYVMDRIGDELAEYCYNY